MSGEQCKFFLIFSPQDNLHLYASLMQTANKATWFKNASVAKFFLSERLV